MSESRPLRFAIMCSSDEIEAWQATVLRRLLVREGVEPVLIIRRREDAGAAIGRLAKLRPFSTLLWRLYVHFYVLRRSGAMQTVALKTVLPGVPERLCSPVAKGKFGVGLKESDLAAIRGYDLDFILLIEFGILKGDILRAARYGVWSFHHDDPQQYRGLPPAFWEIYDGAPVSGAILQRLTERLVGGVILQRGWVQTLNDSYVRNIDAVLGSGVDWPAKVCADIQHGVADYLDSPPVRTTAPVRYLPTNGETLRFFALLARNTFRRFFRLAFRNEQWGIGIADVPITEFLRGGPLPLIRWLPEPGRGRFLADPFAWETANGLTILAEEYDYRTSKGIIAALDVQDGRVSSPHTVLELPDHLSYPYLFEHDGEVYCVPEMGDARKVVLYRATRFPDEWEAVATLVEGFGAVDATIFWHEGRWWLLCTDVEHDPDTVLHAFWSDALFGPWQAHSSNPLKVDVRSARPAGTPFIHEGQLYRPVQDSSRVYGGAIVVQRVHTLTPTEFWEEAVARIEPDAAGPYPDGLHTLSAAGQRTVLDAKREIFILPALQARFRQARQILSGQR